jgi:hypothetical protein
MSRREPIPKFPVIYSIIRKEGIAMRKKIWPIFIGICVLLLLIFSIPRVSSVETTPYFSDDELPTEELSEQVAALQSESTDDTSLCFGQFTKLVVTSPLLGETTLYVLPYATFTTYDVPSSGSTPWSCSLHFLTDQTGSGLLGKIYRFQLASASVQLEPGENTSDRGAYQCNDTDFSQDAEHSTLAFASPSIGTGIQAVYTLGTTSSGTTPNQECTAVSTWNYTIKLTGSSLQLPQTISLDRSYRTDCTE